MQNIPASVCSSRMEGERVIQTVERPYSSTVLEKVDMDTPSSSSQLLKIQKSEIGTVFTVLSVRVKTTPRYSYVHSRYDSRCTEVDSIGIHNHRGNSPTLSHLSNLRLPHLASAETMRFRSFPPVLLPPERLKLC